MANPGLVERLLQGSEVWNAWREQQSADLQLDLSKAKLSGADLRRIRLSGAILSGADLHDANLSSAKLSSADLVGANLRNADLRSAKLSSADLVGARLGGADLSRANLVGARLGGADLIRANLSGARLDGADLNGVSVGSTVFALVDLRRVIGLLDLVHVSWSPVDLPTVHLPPDGGAIHFLRGAGVPDSWITLYRAEMSSPIVYHSCFISYSSKDDILAHRLHADLQDHGVRCWFAPEDLKIGDRFHSRIDEAIHFQDKLLLLLSESAIQSTWVEIEVRAALEKEQRQHRDVLFPVCLDNSVVETSQAWAAMLRRSRHIGDFSNWTEPQAYQQAFARLLRDLKKADERRDQETKP